jgi:TrmH RNA methyltransferase
MDEQTVYGMKAALALLERRPEDVLRLHFRADRLAGLKKTLAGLAARRLPYRELDEESLRKVAGGPHHEGLVVVARPLCYRPPPERLPSAGLWLALDGVDNPHNLGAILRTCAFFGVQGALAGGEQPGQKVNAAVLRVAEGGAEYVPLHAAPDLAGTLRGLRAGGLPVLGLETDAPAPLEAAPRAATLVLAVGNESAGLSQAVRAACTGLHALRGAGPLRSLNVSVATAVALSRLMEPGR